MNLFAKFSLVLALFFVTTSSAEAQVPKTFWYDQYDESLALAAMQITGATGNSTQPGWAQGEAFGQFYRPEPGDYPVKILGVDLIMAAPPNMPNGSVDAYIEVWLTDGDGPNPGTSTPEFSIHTSELFNSATQQFGLPLVGNTGLAIDFDWSDPTGHPPMISSGNFLVVVRFDSPAADMQAEWGTYSCASMPTYGLCGCQEAGTLNDQASVSNANIINYIGIGQCSGTAATWDWANDMGIQGDYIMRARTEVAGSCTADCTNKVCGDDGCGGSCGNCAAGETCESGACVGCVADCDGKDCGGDGCGGSCGTCAAGETCVSGLCEGCTGDCTGMECGDDGCGNSCGTCAAGETCEYGSCVGCTPDCAGKVCGDDGCGGTCGDCAAGEVCEGYACVACTADCTGLDCGPDGCGGSCGTCGAGETCNNGLCEGCTPDCTGKDCGDDGCGNSCGNCGAGESCEQGVCVGCTPDCSTSDCGDDGCGGSCGVCGAGEACDAGVCVPEGDVVTLEAISPDFGYQDVETDVSITGTGFASGATVMLGGTNLSAVQVVSGGLISATVPAEMEAGDYMLVVANSDGSTASLNGAFTVREREGSNKSGGCGQAGAAGGLGALWLIMLVEFVRGRRRQRV